VTTQTGSTPQGEPSDSEPDARRSVFALIGAAVLVVVVVVAVLVFGVERPPPLASITDPGPQVSGSVAWTAWEDGRVCVHVASPTGAVRSPYCGRDGGEIVGWTDDGLILHTWTATGSSEVVVDPDSGVVVDRRPLRDEIGREFPESVRAFHEDGRLVVEQQDSRTVIWTVEAPDAYDVFNGVRSPDGEWVALTDSARRLLVVPADGSAPPRVWVKPFEGWSIVVWEGTDPFGPDAPG
jgi:hypothetical protein